MSSPSHELQRLLQDHGLTYQSAADLLQAATGEQVTRRKIQKWLQRPGTVSRQRCPGWVPYVLRRELAGVDTPLQ